jgi:hypothetical protein
MTMPKRERRKLERVQYWQGQMLRARDFLDLQAVESQRRWWHNRAVHNAYGIAEGLQCSPMPFPSTAAQVTVSPGVAYDIFGRELILERAQSFPVPATGAQGLLGPLSLLMRYKPPSRRLNPNEVSEVCWNAPGSFSAGTAEFVWKVGLIGFTLDPAEGVAVFAVQYGAEGLTGQYPNYIPVSTPPVASPLLAAGATIPGSTPWTPWTIVFANGQDQSSGPMTMGVQTWIDTSAAGFTQIPCYFVQLEGALCNPQAGQFVPALFQSIADESITGFMFRIWLQPVYRQDTREPAPEEERTFDWGYITDPYLFGVFAQQQNLYVSWIGCQKRASIDSCCAPQNSAAVNTLNQVSGSALHLR